MTQERHAFTDEMLTAYLDGEADAATAAEIDVALTDDEELAERLAALNFPMADLRQIMSPDVLGAPQMPSELLAVEEAETAVPANSTRRPLVSSPLALVASFLVGMVVTTLVPPSGAPSDPPAKAGWIETIASYQSLYVTDTLDTEPQSLQARDAVFAKAEETFNVSLEPAVELTGVAFKRAQILGFRGKTLLQMAYLAEDGTPMALCLIKTDNPDRGTKAVEMFDMAGISWVKDGVGYFLIGGEDSQRIDNMSAEVIAAL